MANIVLSISTNIQKEVMAYYGPHFIERKAPGVIFAAKLPDTAITMYKSGKLMFQGGAVLNARRRAGGELLKKLLLHPPLSGGQKGGMYCLTISQQCLS